MIKLVIFDIDGLLIDSERMHYEFYRQACRQHNLPEDIEIFKRTVGQSEISEVELFSRYYPPEKVPAFHADWERMCFQHMREGEIPIKKGVWQLLDELEQRGIQKAVASSQRKELGLHVLAKTGIGKRMAAYSFADMVPRGKPAPDIFLHSAGQFSLPPEHCLVLEDSEAGIKAAIAAHIPVIAVPDMIEPNPALLAQCHARCESLLEVIPYLD